MRYSPGSFSKNFAWHGRGLQKLQEAIRDGFGNKLEPVGRENWRRASGISHRLLDLIPINFFMYNSKGQMAVDELVFQATRLSHTTHFDRLALFAFHLSNVGDHPQGVREPALWANEFVREVLWKDGAWRSEALDDGVLNDFMKDRLDAQPGVRRKCLTNYRHLFELCGYLPTNLPLINSGAQQWLTAALFLLWDRELLEGHKSSDLLTSLSRREVHKLLGIEKDYLDQRAESALKFYLESGALLRHAQPSSIKLSADNIEDPSSDWLMQGETDEAVRRTLIEVSAQIRNRKKAADLKKHYGNQCVICGTKLLVGTERYYSEAAHIRPLGRPHDGPDNSKNMLVLCPNHHLQFDRGTLRLKKVKDEFVVMMADSTDALHGKKIEFRHPIDEEFLLWHFAWFSKEL